MSTTPSYNGYVSKASYLESMRQWLLECAERDAYLGKVADAAWYCERAARLAEEIRREQAQWRPLMPSRGTCAVCERDVPLSRRGRAMRHKRQYEQGLWVICSGVGKLPAEAAHAS